MFEAKQRLAETGGQIDVFDALASLDIIVMFRPLDGLLGAYLRGSPPGVLISTKRQPSVQRFTGAHELGHAILQHEPSIDTPDVLRRAALGEKGKGTEKFSAFLQEVEADAFAGDFLLPHWLLAHHASKNTWSGSDFRDASIVYQLALRCGASFDATTRALERNRVIDRKVGAQLRDIKPKHLKSEIKRVHAWADPWSDTWLFTSSDAGQRINSTVGDLVEFRLREHSAGGYRWHLDQNPAFVTLSDETSPSELVGGIGERILTLRCEESTSKPIVFEERRPWEAQGDILKFDIRAEPREEGLARANRVRAWS